MLPTKHSNLQQVRSPDYWGLNSQQAAFFAEDSHCLCVACPGAGKTRTVIAKLARFCLELSPAAVMAITFTRAGAMEMGKRLSIALPTNVAKAVRTSTFHSLAYRQLSMRQDIKLISAADQQDLVSRARERVGSQLGLEKLSEMIGGYQRSLGTTVPAADSDEYEAYQVYLEYRSTMASHGAMDMDDMIRTCLQGYQSGLLKPPPIKALMVDEFQDIDEVQLALILEFAKRGAIISVVGDDDQSIYSFRSGLGHAGMIRFAEALDAKTCFLDKNYRCAPVIVETASRVIEYNAARIEKQLLSGNDCTGNIQLFAFSSTFDEAEAVIRDFQHRHVAGKRMAVLARTNNWLDTIELSAISQGISLQRVGDQGFLHRRHVVNAISALKLGINPADRLALISCLHSSGISMAGITHVEQALPKNEGEFEIFELLYDAEFVGSLEKQDATLLREFRAVLGTWINGCERGELANSHSLKECLSPLLSYFGAHGRSDWHRQDISTLGRIVLDKLSGSLKLRVRTLDNWARRSKRKGDEESSDLILMTVHGAKGLEFDRVWIAGCNERVFPYEKCNVEEERRLFYVALTRARTDLCMSFIADGTREPSRFTAESGIALTLMQEEQV